MSDEDRFWAKVDMKPEGCWLWQGATRNGYGAWKLNGKTKSTHRTSYEFEVGWIPEGLIIHHTCDTRLCVNPAHLKAVTYRENTMDAIEKGRHHLFTLADHARGEEVFLAKLNSTDVREIRRLYDGKVMGYRRLASVFGVDRKNIKQIVKRETWRHI